MSGMCSLFLLGGIHIYIQVFYTITGSISDFLWHFWLFKGQLALLPGFSGDKKCCCYCRLPAVGVNPASWLSMLPPSSCTRRLVGCWGFMVCGVLMALHLDRFYSLFLQHRPRHRKVFHVLYSIVCVVSCPESFAGNTTAKNIYSVLPIVITNCFCSQNI